MNTRIPALLLAPSLLACAATTPRLRGVRDEAGFVADAFGPQLEGRRVGSSDELMQYVGLERSKIGCFREGRVGATSELRARLAAIRAQIDVLMRPAYAYAKAKRIQALRFPRWKGELTRAFVNLRRTRRTKLGHAYAEEQFQVRDPLGFHVSGRVLVPIDGTAKQRRPGVLYLHFHGSRFALGTAELHLRRFRGQRLDFAERLINQGYVVLAVDAPGHGRRLPAHFRGTRALGRQFENMLEAGLSALGLSRTHLVSIGDLTGFHLLRSHPNVDPQRIAAFGFSYGSLRAYRLAAVLSTMPGPYRLRALVGLGLFPRLQDTIRQGKAALNINHPFFPSQLRHGIDTEALVFAGSPTPMLLFSGDNERYSPGWREVFDFNRWAWSGLGVGARLELVEMTQPGYSGHNWYPLQVERALRFLSHWLKGKEEVLLDAQDRAALDKQRAAAPRR